ncbi:MAG TPA: SagB/ThcOx family dehydrogenase [Methanoregulaceae archaeon]|nr:SagB/ThcOx family dehydrogenase [Methanoregulaceae archaeon]HQJ88479.1 SagB/ThcOx family dehydrogenase [Methanoregulaceae archaeon]
MSAKRDGIGREFLAATRAEFISPSDQMLGLPQPLLELSAGDGPEIPLPDPSEFDVPPLDLWEAIVRRESVRDYTPDPISLQELSYLLFATQGVRTVVGGEYTLRTVPSAGARHAFETYLLIQRVDGVPPGLYRFLALDHRLREIEPGRRVGRRVAAACYHQPFVGEAAVVFLWTAVPYRMTWRYGERGYRYLFLDAGHVCQNLYLAAEPIGCGVCAVGAFDDEAAAAALGLEDDQFLVYVAALGRRRSP